MAKQNKVMARGLNSLLSADPLADFQEASHISTIRLEEIEVNPDQPRREFDAEALKELSQSILSLGLIQPITLLRKAEGRYMIIAGERRYRAAQMAGLKELPAYIRELEEGQVLELALVENIQRQDLNAIEIALSLESLTRKGRFTHEQVAERIGKNRSTVTNYIRLLTLPGEVQLGLTARKISMGHARALLGLKDPAQQMQLYHKILEDGLSVRQVEQLIRALVEAPIAEGEQARPTRSIKETDTYQELIDRLSRAFHAEVKLKRSKSGKGQLTIPFSDEGELIGILALLDKLH